MTKLVKRAGAVIVKDKKVLVERSKGKNFFIPPGGQVEEGETMQEALIRELFEELQIKVLEKDLKEFSSHSKAAGGQENYDVQMDLFLIEKFQGEINPNSEVEEIVWVDSANQEGIKLGSIFEFEVLPKLKTSGLIS